MGAKAAKKKAMVKKLKKGSAQISASLPSKDEAPEFLVYFYFIYLIFLSCKVVFFFFF